VCNCVLTISCNITVLKYRWSSDFWPENLFLYSHYAQERCRLFSGIFIPKSLWYYYSDCTTVWQLMCSISVRLLQYCICLAAVITCFMIAMLGHGRRLQQSGSGAIVVLVISSRRHHASKLSAAAWWGEFAGICIGRCVQQYLTASPFWWLVCL